MFSAERWVCFEWRYDGLNLLGGAGGSNSFLKRARRRFFTFAVAFEHSVLTQYSVLKVTNHHKAMEMNSGLIVIKQ